VEQRSISVYHRDSNPRRRFVKNNFTCVIYAVPIPVAAQSTAWICGRLLAGNVGSNPTGGMDVCLLLVSCVVR
jgi:hypothetical protein